MMLGVRPGRDQAGKEQHDKNGKGFYQFNLVRLGRLAAAETASPLAFVRRDEFTRNGGV
jgi:hypothetical protein